MTVVRKTKIVCSIGPASSSPAILAEMVGAGMDVARINMSHGSYEEHSAAIANVRAAAQRFDRVVAILGDLCGPKLRITSLPDGLQSVTTGQRLQIAEGAGTGDDGMVLITPLGVAASVQPGEVIAFADGAVKVLVQENVDGALSAIVTQAGPLALRKGVNFPDSALAIPAMTEKDYADLGFLLEEGVDFVALSFVGSATDIAEAKAYIASQVPVAEAPRVIAKIERKEALRRIAEIAKASDGVMVARGDLGVETPVERVPIEQKRIIHLANEYGKPVITATQMLESMVSSASPTRAEASDVANAIFDGTDAIMLSAETAVGSFPAEAVAYMDRIALATEGELGDRELSRVDLPTPSIASVADSIGGAAQAIARSLPVAVIVAVTESGHSARVISRFRPNVAIVGATPNAKAARSLALSFGVVPAVIGRSPSTELVVRDAISAGVALGLCDPGDLCVLVAGIPFGVRGTTNLIKVQVVGEGFLSNGDLQSSDIE